MSFTLTVPAGPAADFAARAAAAKVALEAQNESNDYMLTQLASLTADAAIKAAAELVAALTSDGAGASGSITGHHATDDKTASTVSVSVQVMPAQ